jgi:transposase-like protein
MHYTSNIRPTAAHKVHDDPLTLAGLPPLNTTRWTARRKAEVVAAVDRSLVSAEQACEWYGLSPEELGEWRRASDCAGLPGLRISHCRHFRRQTEAQALAGTC